MDHAKSCGHLRPAQTFTPRLDRNLPRFFFHVRDDLDAPDPEGAELPGKQEAWDYACRSARSLMCETLAGEGRITLYHRIDIEDERGDVVATARFADALMIESDEPEPAR